MLFTTNEASQEKVYIPNTAHPDVHRFVRNFFQKKYHLKEEMPRFRIYFTSPSTFNSWRSTIEGYLITRWPGFLKYTTQKNSYSDYSIPWELVYRIEYSNKRNGTELLVDLEEEMIREMNLEA